jgi:hypothetical protein
LCSLRRCLLPLYILPIACLSTPIEFGH